MQFPFNTLANENIKINEVLNCFNSLFSKQKNIKFEFSKKLEAVCAAKMDLLDIVVSLEKQDWTCACNSFADANTERLGSSAIAGFVYGQKGEQEYGVLGYIYQQEKNKIIIDGTLFGKEDSNLDLIYELAREFCKEKLKDMRKLEPREKFSWQTKEYQHQKASL